MVSKIRPTEKLYIALDEYEFAWTQAEVEAVVRWYNTGSSVIDIAIAAGRPQVEVAVLIMDLAEKDKLAPRDISKIKAPKKKRGKPVSRDGALKKTAWMDEEKEFVKLFWDRSTAQRMAACIHRSVPAVYNMASQLGLGKRGRK